MPRKLTPILDRSSFRLRMESWDAVTRYLEKGEMGLLMEWDPIKIGFIEIRKIV